MIDSNILKYLSSKLGNEEKELEDKLVRLENARMVANSSSYNGIKILKNMYYRKYLVNFDNLRRDDNSYFSRSIEQILINQKNSLDMWLDYLLSDEVIYPEWFKYFIFQGIVKFGEYDYLKDVYKERTRSTTEPFIKVDYEVIAFIYDNLIKYLNGEGLEDKELEKIISDGDFFKLYKYSVDMVDYSLVTSHDDKMRLRVINNKLALLNSELSRLEEEINKVPYGDMETYNTLYEKIHNIRGSLYRLEEERFSIVSLVKYNDEIELRRSKFNKYNFDIYLRNTQEYIGDIRYRKFHVQGYLGDIGYTICGEFRGHGYAYQALELISEKLYEDHIPSFLITTYEDNISSKKTIEKYGGKFSHKEKHEYSPKDVLVYSCETRVRDNNKKVK